MCSHSSFERSCSGRPDVLSSQGASSLEGAAARECHRLGNEARVEQWAGELETQSNLGQYIPASLQPGGAVGSA